MIEKRTWSSRRRFLALAAGPLVAPPPPLGFRAPRSLITPEQFKKQLKGPIFSIVTVYNKDYTIDYDSIRRMIERAIKHGIKIFSLTGGNSQYDWLTYEEIKELTRVMVESVAGRGITIASTAPWWTGQAVDYARFAESIGADALQVRLPSTREGTNDTLFSYYRTIANNTRLPLVMHGSPPLDLLSRLVAIESLAAMKEEFTIKYTLPVYREFGSRLSIFAGGSKGRFLQYQPYGMQAYYTDFGHFAPQLASRFWKAVQDGNLTEAREIAIKYNVPFIQRWSHPFWRATFEYFGVASRYMRPPEPTYTDRQMEEVKAFYRGLSMHPDT